MCQYTRSIMPRFLHQFNVFHLSLPAHSSGKKVYNTISKLVFCSMQKKSPSTQQTFGFFPRKIGLEIFCIYTPNHLRGVSGVFLFRPFRPHEGGIINNPGLFYSRDHCSNKMRGVPDFLASLFCLPSAFAYRPTHRLNCHAWIPVILRRAGGEARECKGEVFFRLFFS